MLRKSSKSKIDLEQAKMMDSSLNDRVQPQYGLQINEGEFVQKKREQEKKERQQEYQDYL